MKDAKVINKEREELEDLWKDNAKQGRHLLTSIPDHHTQRDSHKKAWNCYEQLTEECNELEQEAWRELERGRLGEQGLERVLSLGGTSRKTYRVHMRRSTTGAQGRQQALHRPTAT